MGVIIVFVITPRCNAVYVSLPWHISQPALYLRLKASPLPSLRWASICRAQDHRFRRGETDSSTVLFLAGFVVDDSYCSCFLHRRIPVFVRVAIRHGCLVPTDYGRSTSPEDNENVDDAHCADVNVRRQLGALIAASLSGSVWLRKGKGKQLKMDVMGATDTAFSST